jgi:hypothetical protein
MSWYFKFILLILFFPLGIYFVVRDLKRGSEKKRIFDESPEGQKILREKAAIKATEAEAAEEEAAEEEAEAAEEAEKTEELVDIMEYEIEAFDADSGIFSGAHDKLAKQFQKLAQKRVKDGWILHSYDTVAQKDTIFCTCVWHKE